MTAVLDCSIYRRYMALISVDELARRIDTADPQLVVFDSRFDLNDHGRGRRDFDDAHIPGARFIDLHTELAALDGSSTTGGGRHPLPRTASFRAVLERHGVSRSSFVVVYDDSGGAIAARLWWMLRAIGHQHVAVLDGGIPAWRAQEYPVTDEVMACEPTSYEVPEQWPGIVTADEIEPAIAQGRTVIDSRAAIRYRGESEPLDPRAGHIPGAVNLFHGGHLDVSGHHRPVAELRDRFASIDLGDQPIVYCGSGVTACHNLLVMCLVGLAEPGEALLYPGSWSEWSADTSRPAATGDRP